ncbi:helix-turn-helix DNA binding protein [Mycobacterium phage Ellie]|uniref:Helix-turn-helix DNA binding protein n=1 Tax=Mycobacterium phage Ellie TaxID=2762405 RepID=A0A7G8LLY7_9CAUD|nr:HTH DNA binding protein [Mycobacterium phage Ellie]QNJ58259.1 helix-turn-helix DNA binding protein [Mycobacterium phage Ellie]QTF82036.1 hypothetical protein SEA_FEFFERHEAD_36 [Mycobacterium phage Fefferhead]
MSTPTMTVRQLSEQEAAQMARGLAVNVGGRRRTIPAMNVARYENTVEQIEAMYPGPERAHERRAAIESAALYLVDEADAESVGNAMHEAREQYEAAIAATRLFVMLSVEDDATEAGLARGLGIDRLTVRKYRGKQDRAK